MPARLIVDGNNVMGSRPDGWWRDRAAATRQLVERLTAAGEDVIVIFDGAPPPDLVGPPGVDVRFARRAGRDAADDEIAALVAADPAPHELRVVTSDARLAERVRAHGAAVIGARRFRDRLDTPESRP